METVNVEVQVFNQKVRVPLAVYGHCPLCREGFVYDSAAGALGCTRCPLEIRREYYRVPLTEADIVDLITRGETRRIDGFQSEGNLKAFAARLRLAGGQVRLSFVDCETKAIEVRQ